MPPSFVYLDTSALVRRAEASVATPDPRNAHAGPPVATLLASDTATVSTSEIGLLEFHDVVTTRWRDTNPATSQFDENWIGSAISVAMDDVGSARLTILPLPPKAFEQAMALVTMATRSRGQGFRVWDAVHLVTATAWAADLGETVELWTTDQDFENFVALFPHFGRVVQVRNLDH